MPIDHVLQDILTEVRLPGACLYHVVEMSIAMAVPDGMVVAGRRLQEQGLARGPWRDLPEAGRKAEKLVRDNIMRSLLPKHSATIPPQFIAEPCASHAHTNVRAGYAG